MLPSALKKILLLIFFILSITLVPQVKAADLPSIEKVTPDKWGAGEQAVYSGYGLLNFFSCGAAGVFLTSKSCPNIAMTDQGPQVILSYQQGSGGAISAGTNFIAQLYNNQPASGVQYVAKAMRNGVQFVNPAYAQVTGTGQSVIAPVEKLWELSRNIAFLIFTILLLAIGFMIMFRQKINPQTVISIQNALPGVIIALIVVNFSYMISGFLIDLAFLGSQLVGMLLLTQGQGLDTNAASTQVYTALNQKTIISWFFEFMNFGQVWNASNQISTPVTDIINSTSNGNGSLITAALGALAACANPLAIAGITTFGPAGLAVCGTTGALAGGFGAGVIISIFLFIVLLFGMLQALFRLLFSLITAYITIILMTIFGPFMVLASAIPGNSGALGFWWRQLLANSLIFPAVFGMFILIKVILSYGAQNLNQFGQTLPFFGGTSTGFIPFLIAYGLLFASPAIPEFIKDTFKAKAPATFEKAIIKNVGVGAAGTGLVSSTLGYGAYRMGGGGLLGYVTGKFPQGRWRDFAQKLRNQNLGTSKK